MSPCPRKQFCVSFRKKKRQPKIDIPAIWSHSLWIREDSQLCEVMEYFIMSIFKTIEEFLVLERKSAVSANLKRKQLLLFVFVLKCCSHWLYDDTVVTDSTIRVRIWRKYEIRPHSVLWPVMNMKSTICHDEIWGRLNIRTQFTKCFA